MTKITTRLGLHNISAVQITKPRIYNRRSGETFYTNEIILIDADGDILSIDLFGDIEFPIKVVED